MKAAYEETRAILPGMLKRKYGKLIYITTGSARYTMPAGVMTFAIAKSSLVWWHLLPVMTATFTEIYIPADGGFILVR